MELESSGQGRYESTEANVPFTRESHHPDSDEEPAQPTKANVSSIGSAESPHSAAATGSASPPKRIIIKGKLENYYNFHLILQIKCTV